MAKPIAKQVLSVVTSKKSASILSSFVDDDLLAPGVPLCPGCSVELALRFMLRIMGSETILFTTPGCAASAIVTKGLAPTVKARTFGCLLTNVPAVMTGVRRFFSNKGKSVRCVAFVGDGCTADVGFQPLSGAAERNENIIYICYDNEAYMNTGIQRSGTTPRQAWTTTTPLGGIHKGKKNESKNMPLIMACHGISYVATATVGFLGDFARKLERAKSERNGMSYIHLLTPCPLGWKMAADKVLEISRLAVESNYFPLWEMDRGVFRLTRERGKTVPLETFVKQQGRFKHLTSKGLEELQRTVSKRYAILKGLAPLTTTASKSALE